MTIDQLAPIILALTSYTAGFLSGMFVRAIFKDKQSNDAGYVLIVVTTVWALSMVIDILSPAYETSPLVHALMGAIVGFFYRPGGGNNGKN